MKRLKKAIRRRPHTAPPEVGFGLHPVLEQVYANRGVQQAAELTLGLEQLLPPADLLGLDAAAVMLADALESQSRIIVVGDFDADGLPNLIEFQNYTNPLIANNSL